MSKDSCGNLKVRRDLLPGSVWLLPQTDGLRGWSVGAGRPWEGGAQAGLELKAGAPEGQVRGGEEMRLQFQALPVERTWARLSAVLSGCVTFGQWLPFPKLCLPLSEGTTIVSPPPPHRCDLPKAKEALVPGTRGKAPGLTVYP